MHTCSEKGKRLENKKVQCKRFRGYKKKRDKIGMGYESLHIIELLSVQVCNAYKLMITKYGSCITKYDSTLYIGTDEVLAHYACTF